jgi:hypothetical protein
MGDNWIYLAPPARPTSAGVLSGGVGSGGGVGGGGPATSAAVTSVTPVTFGNPDACSTPRKVAVAEAEAMSFSLVPACSGTS